MNIRQLLKNKIIASIVTVIVIIFIMTLIPRNGGSSLNPFRPFVSPTPISPNNYNFGGDTKASPIQKSTIGLTTDDQLKQLPNLLKTENLGNNQTKYSYKSELDDRPSQVITKNGVASYERVLEPEDPHTLGYLKLSQYIKKYGFPEKIAPGSQYYGWVSSTYIYAKRGITLIANPATNEVFEVQLFNPTSVQEYTKSYGDDIPTNEKSPGDKLY